jgi:UDP-glucuronate decarboxylase
MSAGHGEARPVGWNAIVEVDIATILDTSLPWERLADTSVLVTGAAGFLATYMVETLLAMRERLGFGPRRVIGLVRSISRAEQRYARHLGRSDFCLLESDVADPALRISEPVDVIIHAASPATPRVYRTDPVAVLDANLQGMRTMLAVARRDKASLLFISSGEVYGQARVVPTGESDYGYLDLADVRSCYGEAKRAAEVMGVAWAHQFDVAVRIVRPFHTYGPGVALDDGRVFADFVGDVLAGRDIVMRSGGSAVRAFCYIADAVAGFFTVLFKGERAAAYNIGSDTSALTIADLAQLLAALFPEKGLKVVQDLTPRGTSYANSPIDQNVPAIDRARALGWAPRVTPEEGFRRMVQSYG